MMFAVIGYSYEHHLVSAAKENLPPTLNDVRRNTQSLRPAPHPEGTLRLPTGPPSGMLTFRSWIVLLRGNEHIILIHSRRCLKKRFQRGQVPRLLTRRRERPFIEPCTCH